MEIWDDTKNKIHTPMKLKKGDIVSVINKPLKPRNTMSKANFPKYEKERKNNKRKRKGK